MTVHSYFFDHIVNRTTETVADAAGTRTTTYDAYGNVASENFAEFSATQMRSYDAFGRELYTTLKRGDETLALFGQSYDAASGRIAAGAYGNIPFAYSYLTGTHLVSEIAVLDGYLMTKKIAYEADRDLPIEIAYEKPDASLVAKRNYTYDTLGRVSARTQTRGEETPRNDVFGYNTRSELTSATLGSDNYAYAFDHIGNRATEAIAIANSESRISNYSANNLNQYTDISTGEAVSSPLQYDADGNATQIQTSTGTWIITYNGENRPIRFENAETQTVVECVYDSQGRRFEKKVTVAGTTTLRERYLYKGYLQIAAFDLSESEETLRYALKHIIYWDPTEPTATRPLAINITGDGLYFPTVDLTKNVCELVDAYGDIAATYDYAPFGAVTAGTPSGSAVPANPLQWSSEIYDSELDLIYYNYRHYSPALGRFLSRDPIAEQGGLNLYAFVGNRILRRVDYLGLNDCVDISFTVSYTFKSKQVKVLPFLFVNVSGAVNISATGQVCKSCCNGKKVNTYQIGASVSGESTLTATLGFAFSEEIDGIFSADVWGGIQAYGGGGISGAGTFSKDCTGTHGRGVGTVSGTAGLQVGAEVRFSLGKWSLGTTGLSGGGRSVATLPFNFICSENSCSDLSWGEATGKANLFLRSCAFGICFEKTF